jgi:transposase
VFEIFAPIFDIDDPTDNRKHYLPVKTHETVKTMRRAGDSVAEISQRMGVHPSTVYRMTATRSERADTTSS